MSKLIDSVKISIASPEDILSWSYGEVTKFGTKSYKSFEPEPQTIYGEEIFGPAKDYTCKCGLRHPETMYRGTKCKKCGVEYTKASVRRERMGHIALASPIVHHYYKDTIKMLLNLKSTSEKGTADKEVINAICYCNKYVVISAADSGFNEGDVISNADLQKYDPEGYSNEYYKSQEIKEISKSKFVALTGAKAIQYLLHNLDLYALRNQLLSKVKLVDKNGKSISKKSKNEPTAAVRLNIADQKRLALVESFINSGNKPEWMVLTVLPVIPPDLRPLVSLQHGHMSSSDLNDLYNDIISWNDNVKDASSKFFLLNNYITNIRCLQQAVDRLINNENLNQLTSKAASNQPHKSLTGHLSHKKGRFRHDLLGVRVDYSGRSSIAVSPTLKLYQCGVPREMALTLFRPFLVRKLVVNNICDDENKAEAAIDNLNNNIWDSLKEVMQEHPVLLNRQPSLHKLSIQAFRPVLVDGSAIRLHPLVCPGFNADFDGDTMAIHVVIGDKAIAEAEILMLASNNVLSPKDGKPIITPGQDMVLGNFYINMELTSKDYEEKYQEYINNGDVKQAELLKVYAANEGSLYSSFKEAFIAYQNKKIHLHTRIAVLVKNIGKTTFTEEENKQYLITTVGKILFNKCFPEDFPYINFVKGNTVDTTSRFVKPGTNIKKHIKKMDVAPDFIKKALSTVINEVFLAYKGNNAKVAEILDNIKDLGFEYSTQAGMTISFADMELYAKKPEMKKEGELQIKKIESLYQKGLLTAKDFKDQKKKVWESIQDEMKKAILPSLSRRNPINMSATSGARGSMDNIAQLLGMRGYINSLTNKGENLILSSFIEGLTANEYIIATHGQRKSLSDTALKTQDTGYFSRRMVYAAQNVIITEDDCNTDLDYYISDIVREKNTSSKNKSSDNIIEPLYERIVGRYSKQKVVHPKTGEILVKSNELIDEKIAKNIVDAGISGVMIRNVFTCRSKTGICKKCYGINLSTGNLVEKGTAVGIIAAQSISEPSTQLTMRTFHTGGAAKQGGDITDGFPRVKSLFDPQKNSKNVQYAKIAIITGEITEVNHAKEYLKITSDEGHEVTVKLKDAKLLRNIKKGLKVLSGDKLTEGNIDPRELLKCGANKVQDYILSEVQKVYKSNGVDVNDKHIEVIVKQMLRKSVITDPAGSKFSIGQKVTNKEIAEVNNTLALVGKDVKSEPILMSITQSGGDSESFIASSAFQNTSKNLTIAAINGKLDKLEGIMENVVCNNLIPVVNGSKHVDESSICIDQRALEIKTKREDEAIIVNSRREQARALLTPRREDFEEIQD